MATISATSTPPVTLPIPIFKLAHRYLLYDVNVVTYLRREQNISGVLIGTLPQASQQNVFLGLPLELMPEEARLLVEKDIGYIVDDVAEHKSGYLGSGMSAEERKAYQAALRKQGQGAASEANKKSNDRKKAALKKHTGTENWNDIPDDMLKSVTPRRKRAVGSTDEAAAGSSDVSDDEMLFASPANSFPTQTVRSRSCSARSSTEPEPYGVTPTTSYPPLKTEQDIQEKTLPEVSNSYPLYKHLHGEGYFMAPGLRFGCQYMAYPGDPLRFHSHFLCNGMDWDQEFDLLDLVGGGRLGTGVKKGFLIGGEEAKAGDVESKDVRAFCIEWGGM